VIVGAEAKPPMVTCAVISAVLASATVSRTGSSFGLPSKVIAPRVKLNVFPSRSTLPLTLLQRGDDRRGAGHGNRQLAAPFAIEAMPAHENIAGHVDLDVERHRKRRWLVGGGRRRLASLAVGLDDLQHHDSGR
jgi:hypothetical protein